MINKLIRFLFSIYYYWKTIIELKFFNKEYRLAGKTEAQSHLRAIAEIRNDPHLCQAGFDSGYLSKNQLKKCIADAYNREKDYVEAAGIHIVNGKLVLIKRKL